MLPKYRTVSARAKFYGYRNDLRIRLATGCFASDQRDASHDKCEFEAHDTFRPLISTHFLRHSRKRSFTCGDARNDLRFAAGFVTWQLDGGTGTTPIPLSANYRVLR